uniref:Xyloglucan endotransglucosylase/hydrolase n=1 Tax=Saccharum spontaneum TaxID=62335 RepID=A0A678T548_SACSP|nr:Xyloglucan endotransglucosylase/hydrolase [Saccharum spontaneum]
MHVFKNHDPSGVPYLSEQAMRVHGSLWNDESWATRSGAGRPRQDQPVHHYFLTIERVICWQFPQGLPAKCNLDQIG